MRAYVHESLNIVVSIYNISIHISAKAFSTQNVFGLNENPLSYFSFAEDNQPNRPSILVEQILLCISTKQHSMFLVNK